MHFSEEIGARLQEERKRLSLNQEQLAEKLNVSKRTQAGYEAGTSDPGASYLSKAALQMGIDILYVVTGARVNLPTSAQDPAEAKVIEQYRVIPETDKAVIHRMIGAMAELAGQKK